MLRGNETVLDPLGYADILAAAGADVDAWETTTCSGSTATTRSCAGSPAPALRPVRDALDDDAYDAFVRELAPRLRAAYRREADGGTWFRSAGLRGRPHTLTARPVTRDGSRDGASPQCPVFWPPRTLSSAPSTPARATPAAPCTAGWSAAR